MPDETSRRQKTSIHALFTRIARHYDLVNRLLALGQDQRWRRAALSCVDVPPGGKLLDVATGTGDLAVMARDLIHASVVGVDLTRAMLIEAQRKAADIPWLVSDGLALPFPDATFDAVTSAFMLRNVPDVFQALREQARVVKPGGRVVCLEITWPQRFPMRWLFGIYFYRVPPIVGRLVVGDQAPYRYLPRSVKRFLTPAALADVMAQVGLQDVVWRTMMLNTVAIHVGKK